EREGRHDDHDPVPPQHEGPRQGAVQGRDQDPHQEPQQDAAPRAGDKAHAVRTEAKEGRLPQGDEAHVPHQKAEGYRGQSENDGFGGQVQGVAPRPEGDEQQHSQGRKCPPGGPGGKGSRRRRRRLGPLVCHHAVALPKSPCGLMTRTRAMRAKMRKRATWGKNRRAKPSTSPTSTALQKDPSMCPSPPTTTTMRARRVISASRPGDRARMGAPTTPPRAARPRATPNTTALTLAGGMPRDAATSASAVTARMRMPHEVRCSSTRAMRNTTSPRPRTNSWYAG